MDRRAMRRAVMEKSKSNRTLPRSKTTTLGAGIGRKWSEHFAPAFQGWAERQFVGELQSGAGGQAMGNPSHLQAGTSQPFRQIISGGIAFHVRSEGNDHLLDRFVFHPLFQFGDAEIFR